LIVLTLWIFSPQAYKKPVTNATLNKESFELPGFSKGAGTDSPGTCPEKKKPVKKSQV
jgi:hypothetical protein